MVEKSKAQNSNQSSMEIQEASTTRSPGGILKKGTPARPQLETVSEFTESQMERKDSSLSTDSEKSINMQNQEEQEKFKMLCEGVQNTLALFQTSLAELLALKDELLQHALPPSLLIKMTLVTGKLFRSSSDLSVPITELVRMVKLYSAPWEAKSTALKKLHEDYENKQRQLNVALQKLVLVGIQSERMAQERRVMNWEKLFSRSMSSQAHGYRWKFLIESFKKKAKNGDVYMAASTDEETEREREKNMKQLEGIRRRSKHKETAAKKIMRESLATADKTTTPPTAMKEPEPDEQAAFEDDLVSDPEDWKSLIFDDGILSSREQSPDMMTKRPMSPLITKKPASGLVAMEPTSHPVAKQGSGHAPRPKIQFLVASDDEEEEGKNYNITAAADRFSFTAAKEEKKKTKRPGVKFLSFSDDDENVDKDEEREEVPLRPSPPQVVKVDRSCWTQEPEYERYLHVRVYRPECKKATTPLCSIAFCGVLLKTGEFEAPAPAAEENPETTKAESQAREGKQRGSSRAPLTGRNATKFGASSTSSRVPVTSRAAEPTEVKETPRFAELVFKLPDDSGHVFGQPKIDISKEPLRIAVHPGTNEPMIAMATVNYGDLKVLDHFEGRWSHTNGSDIQQHPLTSVSSDRDMPFNSPCGHVPILCYQAKVERPRHLVKETETATFEELLDAEIEARKEAEKAKKQVAEEVTKPTPVYTEEDIGFLRDQHAKEILSIQEEYEKRLNELAQGLSPFPPQEDESGRFVNVATSPVFLRSPSPLRSGFPDYGRAPQPPAPVAKSPNRNVRPKIPNLPDWGKDLPEDFLVRLAMFADNSVKYHQELGEKTRRAIQQKYELQMAVQNRLNAPTEEQNEEEVCLPAVFMPTRNGHVYSPKAHSYFHPLGSSEGRLTQPPSMFKLPFLPPESQVSVLNLFDVGQKYVSTSAHWTLPDQSRPSTMGTPYVSQTAPPPPPTASGWRTPSPPFPNRAKTR